MLYTLGRGALWANGPSASLRSYVQIHPMKGSLVQCTRLSSATPSSLAPHNTLTPNSSPKASPNMSALRRIHSSERKSSTVADPLAGPSDRPAAPTMEAPRAPLSVLPLSMILRSLGTTMVSSSPVLLPPSLRIMATLAHSSNPILNPDKNPILRALLKRTFYAQFCAGEQGPEVRHTIDNLKKIGFTGVILGYAKEVVLTEGQAKALDAGEGGLETEDVVQKQILPWAEGTLETIRLASPGDFVAMKFTGAGQLALYRLQHRLPFSPYLQSCMDAICSLAYERNVRLLIDAEQDVLQNGIDDWCMELSKKYNKDSSSAIIFNTYQAYKKACPQVISQHLALAKKEGFSLGVKLVRGAYLGSDSRNLFHETKEATDDCYNNIATSVLSQQWSPVVQGEGEYPASSLVLATHNVESVRRARAICDAGQAKSDIAFAQLQGMADEVSCELVDAGKSEGTLEPRAPLPTFKYLVWGTTGECMKYLLRRAQENKDAVARTRSGRDAMLAEVLRRMKKVFSFAG